MGTSTRSAQRGPRAHRGEVAERILTQARESFAADGYAGTTVQGIARAAGVDTKLVRYYFGDKEALLDACLADADAVVRNARAAAAVPLAERGEAIVRGHLRGWADPDLARVMRTSLLIAAHEPAAMARVRAVFDEGLIPAIADDLNPIEVSVRGGLISSQLLGLAFARFVFALDAVATITDDELITQVGATIQRYLTGPLGRHIRARDGSEGTSQGRP